MCREIAAKREQRGEECGAVSASELFWCTGFVVIRSELWNRDSEFREVSRAWEWRGGSSRQAVTRHSRSNPHLAGSPPQRYNRPLTLDAIKLLWNSEVVNGTVMWEWYVWRYVPEQAPE